jgi:multiple sugar transport system substrate-binding protein
LIFRRLIMRARPLLLAVTLAIAPISAKAADLVVWWEKGFNPEEDAAVREIIAAFEQGSGSQVELVFREQEELADAIAVAFETGQPPDFAFGHCYRTTLDNGPSKAGLRT